MKLHQILSYAALLMLLCGCQTEPVINNCLSLKDWTNEQQDQIYIAVQNLPENSPLIAVLADYAKIRAQIKACSN